MPNNRIIIAALMAACALAAQAQLTFSASEHKPVTIKADAPSGLDAIYVLYDTQGVRASYKAAAGAQVTWMRYSNLGGGYAEEVAATHDGNTYSIDLGPDDMGYIIEEGTKRTYVWITNYANHHLRLESLEIADEQECDRARLTLHGDAERITYYTINGAARELSRELTVEYYTLRYDTDAQMYEQITATQTFASILESMGVFAPLCDTYFTLTGDRFLKEWGMEQTIESPPYRAIAVEAQTWAEQEQREVENEQVVDVGELGGSAPVTITFGAAVTDAAIFREWQMSRDPEFNIIEDRWSQLEFSYTFRENGNTYVRFVADNSAGSCEWVGETYQIYVGESNLLCPNVFSPNGDGVNDEWRVSYRSIVEYECHIFNRWGQEMMSSTDPAIGWDGRYHGKLVPTGVYYYVVKARGADGRKYNLKGDINILHSKGHKEGAGGGGEAEDL